MELPLETSRTWREILQALDRASIPSVASQFGVSAGAIASAIRRTGSARKPVVPAGVVVEVDGASEVDEPTESVPPPAVSSPPRNSRIDAFRHLLGVESDGSVARLAGVGREAVQAYRSRHGIPSLRRPAPSVAPASVVLAAPTKAERVGGKRSPLDAHISLLGSMSDSDVASRLGVSAAAVFQYRRRRGIPPFVAAGAGNTRVIAAPAPVVPPQVAARPAAVAVEVRPARLAPAVAVEAPLIPAAPAVEPVVVETPTPVVELPPPAPVAPVVAQPQVAVEPPPTQLAPGVAAHAYSVVVRDGETERSYIVVGTNIADAAGRAVRAVSNGTVVSLVRYLDALV